MPNPESIEPLTQFGAAGLMGALWVWERTLSRRRERQLNEAHERLVGGREQIRVLWVLVRRNTRAIERFAQTQRRLGKLLQEIGREIRKNVRPHENSDGPHPDVDERVRDPALGPAAAPSGATRDRAGAGAASIRRGPASTEHRTAATDVGARV